MLSRLLQVWEVAAEDLQIEIMSPFFLSLPSGAHVEVLVLVKKFGADKGMLVLTDYSEIEYYINELENEGYGFSVFDEPREDESYSRKDFIELLEDWGWSGNEVSKPKWLKK